MLSGFSTVDRARLRKLSADQLAALSADDLLPNAEVGGTIPLWNWIGDEPATTFSY